MIEYNNGHPESGCDYLQKKLHNFCQVNIACLLINWAKKIVMENVLLYTKESKILTGIIPILTRNQ